MDKEFYTSIEEKIKGLGFKIVNKDLDRPWGAFYVIQEEQAQDYGIVSEIWQHDDGDIAMRVAHRG